MTSETILGAIRFGTGLSPEVRGADASALLADLDGPDVAAEALPTEGWETRVAMSMEFGRARRNRRDSDAAEQLFSDLRDDFVRATAEQMMVQIARGVAAPTGFRERLAWFWADHFTTTGATNITRGTHTAYAEEAIRPHLAGNFADLVDAAILHPAMLVYLDQNASVGPNSHNARTNGRGLNENLAREFLELHTVGVGGGYSQADVREMAELLTGVASSPQGELIYRRGNAEPGSETVLGLTFGGAERPELEEVRQAVRTIALLPQTGRHVSEKLARHFVAETPPADLIEAMAAAFSDSQGDLTAVYAAMLGHPAAWAAEMRNVKWPFHYVTSALRALGADPQALAALERRRVRDLFERPLTMMGQRWQGAGGPDGFTEDDAGWITGQGLAGRIGWAMLAPAALVDPLPDPRAFTDTALGDAAPGEVAWAASRAQTHQEGVGIVLAAPAFQRF